MPYLAFNLNDGNEFVFDILEERLSIGRDSKNDIVIDNTYISGFHAEFIRQPDGGYELVDLKSSNGTFLNGKRIDRTRVKGGDKIRFGQLDSRFRERAPKGTAPAAEVKVATPGKGQPARPDGRRGDTESVPARDAAAKSETSPIEPTKMPLARPDMGAKGPALAAPQNVPIQRPPALDPALLKQAEELREEVAKLKQERELLRTENEKEARRREEVRALEKQIDLHQKNVVETEAKLAGLAAALKASEGDVSKLDVKRREVGNLDSQLESTRSELTKVQADISMATKSLQALHVEADKASAERGTLLKEKETAAAELAKLKKEISDSEAKVKTVSQTLADSQKSEAEISTSRSAEMQTLDEQLKTRRLELTRADSEKEALTKAKLELEKSLHELREQSAQLQANQRKAEEAAAQKISDLEAQARSKSEELKALESRSADLTNKLDDLSATDTQLSSANEALKAVESHKSELAAAISQMTQERDTLTRDLLATTEKGKAQHTLTQTLLTRRIALEKEVHGIEEEKSTLSSDLAKARENLRLAEESLTERRQEVSTAEDKTRLLTTQLTETTQQQQALQKESETLQGQIATAKAELEKVSADLLAKKEAAQTAEAAEKKHSAQSLDLQSKVGTLEALLLTLASSQTERQEKLSALESDHHRLQETLTARRLEVTTAEAKLSDLTQKISAQENQLQELAAAEKKLAEKQTALTAANQEFEKVQADLKRLMTECSEHESRLPALRSEAEKLQSDLAAKLKEQGTSESRVKELEQQAKDLESKVKEHEGIQAKLEESRSALTQVTGEHEKLTSILAPLILQRAEYDQTLPALKAEAEALRAELNHLIRDKQATSVALEKAQKDRKAAFEQAEALRAESGNLEKLLNDKRSNLEAETKTKLAEANAADARLRDLQTQITEGEKRAAELSEVQKQLNNAVQGVKEAEKQRLVEEKALADLAKQQENLRKEIAKQTADTQLATGQITELTKKAKVEETRVAEAESRLQKATQAYQASEAKRAEAEEAIAKIREEEKSLRRQIPSLHTESAGLQAMLVTLTKEREEASQFITRLNVTTENSNKKLSELHQQISQLEAAHQVREERLMKAQEEVDKEGAKLKTAQETTRAAEQTLQDLEKEVKELRKKADVARTQTSGLETELSNRLDSVEKLKLEETRLIKEIEAQKLEIQGANATLAELNDKIRHEESRLGEFTQTGGKILTLGAALAGLETRQKESGKTLRDAAERELALQVKINALQESLNRESARTEQIKKDRASLEAELSTFTDQSQKQAATLQAQEAEQRKRLADIEEQVHERAATAERLKSELSELNDRRAEFAQAEAQLHHWKEIEARLRGQLLELEEKHEVLRRGLPTEESTVVMFANDIIKRIDLIDALSSRYAGHNGGDVVAQLRTLRHSFEDILLQHGISEFDIGAGTEVDVELRKRITVVESVPGKNKPRVVETCRSGFIYSREEGHEFILRKVEVRTSSH